MLPADVGFQKQWFVFAACGCGAMAGLVYESITDLPPAAREQAVRKLMEGQRTGRKPFAPEKAEHSPQEGQGQSKYHNMPTVVAGIRFDSKKEARRYEYLMLQLQMGIICDLRLQQDFTLQEAYTTAEGKRVRAIRYRADFAYTVCGTGEQVIEDAKGRRTDVYQIKQKMMAQKGYYIKEV